MASIRWYLGYRKGQLGVLVEAGGSGVFLMHGFLVLKLSISKPADQNHEGAEQLLV